MWQMCLKNSPLYNAWKWVSIRLKAKAEEKEHYNEKGKDFKSKDFVSLKNQERFNGILNVLYNDTRTQFLHSTEIVNTLDLDFSWLVFFNF